VFDEVSGVGREVYARHPDGHVIRLSKGMSE